MDLKLYETFIIKYCHENEIRISYLHLLKFLYFAYISYAIDFDEELFEEKIFPVGHGIDIENFNNFVKLGSGISVQYTWFGLSDIPYYEVISYRNSSGKAFEIFFDENLLYNKQKKTIIDVIDFFKNYSISDMANIIMNTQPYKNAKRNNSNIKFKDIVDYYKE